jgi:thioredoxin-like negative regulator of GroEL
MNLYEKFRQGLPYADFLTKYGTDVHRSRWAQCHAQVALTPDQRQLLAEFTRRMPVLCLAGAWCGDCVNQCPIFEHFARATTAIDLCFLDRDDHRDAQEALRICGGDRVPVLVFFSEDGQEVARFGDRTLSRYRQMMADQAGASCPTGIVTGKDSLLARVTQDWLNEFERVQWLLRLSSRLRQIHND